MSRRLPGNESVISRLQWPKPVVKAKRAIIHQEQNVEREDFYELL
jgi:hypothetical protein